MKYNLLVLLITLFLFSCGNPCDDLDCGLHGTCNEDTESCICDDFYEGEFCETEIRAKFLGDFSGRGMCDYNPGSTFDLILSISAGSASTC